MYGREIAKNKNSEVFKERRKIKVNRGTCWDKKKKMGRGEIEGGKREDKTRGDKKGVTERRRRSVGNQTGGLQTRDRHE